MKNLRNRNEHRTHQDQPGSVARLTGSRILLGAACAAAMLALTACGGAEEEEQVVYTPPPPRVEPPPRIPSVSELKQELRIDQRVYFPDERAPGTVEARQALLEFFDAFARGDSNALGRMLSPMDRRELQAMVQAGQWREATEGIVRIEVYQTGANEMGDECVLALVEIGYDFQPQLWYYKAQDTGFVFEAAPTPPDMMNRLSGTDWISSWHEILREEEHLAGQPDMPVHIPQRNVEEEGGGSSPSSSPGGPDAPPTLPGTPSSPPAVPVP